MKKRILSLLCVVAVSAGLAACGGGGSETPPEAPAAEAPAEETPETETPEAEAPAEDAAAYKDELVIQMGADITDLDPAYLSSVDTSRVGYLLFDHLVRYDHDGNIVPRLAESWETSEDGKTWTFHLRQNATWHDGTPVTAADVKYNYDRILSPDTASPRAADLGAIESIEAPDDYTVVFQLIEPFAAFLDKALMVNPALLAQPAALESLGKEFTNAPVGSGPYKLAEWVPGEKLVLEANEDFYLGAPLTKRVVFKIVADPMTAMIELEQGQVDMLLNVPQEELARFEGSDTIELQKVQDYNVCWLMFNYAIKPFDDVNVRKAIAHSIDVDTIYNSLLSDICGQEDSYLPAISWAYEKDTEPYNYDPELSKQLLAEAGWTDSDSDGILDKDGQKLSVTLSGYTREPENMVMEAMQNYIKQIGAEATLDIMERGALNEKMIAKNVLPTFMLRLSQDNPEPVLFIEMVYSSKGSFNNTNYKNDEVDALLDEARIITDKDERIALYSEAQKLIKADCPAVPLFSKSNIIGLSKKVEGYQHSASCFDILNVRVRQ